MSAPQWKAGDVGVNARYGYRGIYVAQCGVHDRDSCWHNESGLADAGTDNRRPLVVIDPEDREQVERLARVTHITYTSDVPEWPSLSERGRSARIDALTMALRAEVVNKPDEPQGLGAVVEDESLVEHVHLGRGLWAYGTTDGPSKGHAYADITAVRILSEGVAR